MKNVNNRILVATVGLLLGVYTALGANFLPGDASYFALSFALWTALPFGVGILGTSKKQSVLFALSTPIIAFATAYTISAFILTSSRGDVTIIGTLGIDALVLSPFLGYLANQWKNSKPSALWASPIIASLFISEGLAHAISTVNDTVAAVHIAVGVLLFVLLYKKEFGSKSLKVTIPVVALLSAALYLVYIFSFAVMFVVMSMDVIPA